MWALWPWEPSAASLVRLTRAVAGIRALFWSGEWFHADVVVQGRGIGDLNAPHQPLAALAKSARLEEPDDPEF